jgi:hypothetical protein
MKIEVIKNDFGYIYRFELKEPDGTPTDLTGATINLRARHSEDSASTLVKAMTIDTPATDGVVLYTVAAVDFPKEGVYYAEIEVTAAGKLITYPGFTIVVIPKV